MRQEGDVGFWQHVGGVLAIRTMPKAYRMARTMPPKETKGVRDTLDFLTTFMVFQNGCKCQQNSKRFGADSQ